MRPVFQKNIIAVDFLCFEAHLSRALYGEGSGKVFTLQLIAAKRLRSLILVKRNIDDPTRPDCPLLYPEIADLRDHWALRSGAVGGSPPLADQLWRHGL